MNQSSITHTSPSANTWPLTTLENVLSIITPLASTPISKMSMTLSVPLFHSTAAPMRVAGAES
jgi:hypothetical protein